MLKFLTKNTVGAICVFAVTGSPAIAQSSGSNASTPKSQEARRFFGVELVRSDLDISNEFLIEPEVNPDDTGFGIAARIGYRWSSNWQIEARGVMSENIDLFGLTDDTELSEVQLLVGYSFKISKYLRLVPAVGRSKWKLTTQEGRAFNPGPETSMVRRGFDLTYRLGVDFPVNDLFYLSFSYNRSDYVFGDADTTTLTALWHF